MKTMNIISVMFAQLIAARKQEIKVEGKVVGHKDIAAKTIQTSFSQETTSVVTAKNLAQYFLTRLVSWQQLCKVQGKDAFLTSKLMTVSINVNKNGFNSEMKFTINPDRIEKCLERTENLVALIAKAASAPVFGAPDATIKQYLLATPQNVVLAKAIEAPREPKPRKSKKAAAKVINMISNDGESVNQLVESLK